MRFDIASIDRSEVLRYLGYAGQEMTDELSERIDRVVARCLEICQPAGTWRVYDVAGEAVPEGSDVPEVRLAGSALAPRGHDICAHLRGAVAAGIMACTLGVASERELRRLSMVDPLDAVVFDAACTTLVERAADATEAQLVAEAARRGLYTNYRYSPGYGDWTLDAQPQMLAAVDAQRQLGLTLTPTLLLVPTKSVTALVGFFPTPQPTSKKLCSKCLCREFCTIRPTGRTCRG